MAGRVYALLVGINDYGGNPSPLFGCRADVAAMSTLLRARVGDDHYVEETLLDGEATRARIIDRFTNHLGQAGAGDVAVFMFSGHGSFERVEERFWFLEPTGQNQTLVCADSRTKRAGDLADKELNELIRVVADDGPHVVVVLDCCHSGGGTRDPAGLPEGVRVRLAPPADEPRAVASYVPGVRALVETAGPGAGPATLAHPRHVALSACEPTQLSKEIPVGDGTRGVFSLSLERALTSLPATATYRDLLGAAANAVRNAVADQDPLLFVEGEEVDQPFLGGVVQPRPATITLEHERDGWFVDAGRAHGIHPPREGATTVLGIRGPAGDGGRATLLGRVRVTGVEPTRSAVEAVDFAPEPGTRYDAGVIEMPAPAAAVELQGDPAAVELVRQALAGSAYVREASGGDGDGLRFVVRAEDGQLVVARADGTPITDGTPADPDGAARTVRRLDHLARWHEIRDVVNPTSPLADQLAIEIVPARAAELPPPVGTQTALAPDETGVVRLAYERAGDGWVPPAAFVYLHNHSDRNLYCTLLDLTDRFRSNSTLFAVSELAAGGSTVAFGGRPVAFSVPEERLERGGTEVRDWLKLIASERRFDPGAFDLPILDGVLPDEQRWLEPPRQRDAGAADAGPPLPEWATVMVTVLTQRPPETVAVPAQGSVDVGGVVTVEAHPALAGARAATASVAAPGVRTADSRPAAPTAIVSDPTVAVPLRLGDAPTARGPNAPAADHLELSGEFDPDRVTPANPVRLHLRADVGPGDVVLAVARDGDVFIPLGVGVPTVGGGVDVTLSCLPSGEATEGATRGVGRSVRIFFQNVIDRRLGRELVWPRLALVSRSVGRAAGPDAAADPAPPLELETGQATVADAVARSGRTLLVVHGLLGDTATLLPPLLDALGDRYDAVLAFDFDSVGAGVEDTATALLERLAAIGVDADHPVDVVAVSTGALVVRWLGERLAGAPLVRHAVLVGAPNAGTPWASIQGWATSLVGVGINALSTVVWPARALGWLVRAAERLDQGIDDVAPGSAVLDALATTSGGAPQYTVLAGNSSLVAAAEVDAEDGRLGRLLTRLGTRAAGWAVFRQPNDLVATTVSQRSMPERLEPAPAVVEVAADHLTYFSRPEVLAAVATALTA